MYNSELEEKMDATVQRWQSVEKKKMFGGVGYLIKGNMCFGIYKDFLIVRIDKEQGDQILKERNVRPFGVAGKPMAGWIMMTEAGWRNRAERRPLSAPGKRVAGTAADGGPRLAGAL